MKLSMLWGIDGVRSPPQLRGKWDQRGYIHNLHICFELFQDSNVRKMLVLWGMEISNSS